MISLKVQSVALQELRDGDSFLQSGFWGLLKSFFGWKPYAFCVQGKPLLVLTRKIGHLLTVAYIPHGPDVPHGSQNARFLKDVSSAIEKYFAPKPVFIRFDLPWIIKSEDFYSLAPELMKAVSDIQPPVTVLVSLKETEEEILRRMKTKTRYNIRLAGKKGVQILRGGKDLLSEWYELYKQTARRDNITIHSKEYYMRIFNIASSGKVSAPKVQLFTAEWEGELLAGIIVLIYGMRATYLYGASSNSKRNLMPNYALQWEAMKYAKSQGCEEYDLFGIPPADDPSHPMYGLYRFKTGFGGQIVRRPGCWDLPLNRPVYALYRSMEKFRKWYYKKFRK